MGPYKKAESRVTKFIFGDKEEEFTISKILDTEDTEDVRCDICLSKEDIYDIDESTCTLCKSCIKGLASVIK